MVFFENSVNKLETGVVLESLQYIHRRYVWNNILNGKLQNILSTSNPLFISTITFCFTTLVYTVSLA